MRMKALSSAAFLCMIVAVLTVPREPYLIAVVSWAAGFVLTFAAVLAAGGVKAFSYRITWALTGSAILSASILIEGFFGVDSTTPGLILAVACSAPMAWRRSLWPPSAPPRSLSEQG
ncbi:hypothetical protein [Spirillospora albida]|uniref:hypothetical protein n=1 Tax=Spirillospora albida TaxID=58123 RepID=UPI0012FC8646|nr:hypothetical protein [Spirillospora albida]